MARKAKDTPHLRLRIEPSLLARLEKSAEKNERTLTGEIVERLNASFKRDDMEALMKATAKEMADSFLQTVNAIPAEKLKILTAGGGNQQLSREYLASMPRLPKSQAVRMVEEMFDLDLQIMAELDPDTPIDEHARRLRELNARRAARLKP
jgi:hypothetical protein